MTRAALALAAGLLLAGCPSDDDPDDDGVREGDCEIGALHCVDGTTIQECPEGVWSDPAECPPETTGEPPLEVEIETYCTEYGCRPGG